MRGAVESHGGTVTQLLGDGVKAVFGIPRVAEDDAIRAVRAAVAMQEAFRALAEQQRGAVGKTGLRVAVNTGEVVANDEAEIIGDPVNVAARLQEQGADGDVVVGELDARDWSRRWSRSRRSARFALKGRAEAVAAYRVESLERPAGAATAAFVGRDDEIARITAVYETAVEKPATALAVLVGSPGLGKSRLIDEFARRLGERRHRRRGALRRGERRHLRAARRRRCASCSASRSARAPSRCARRSQPPRPATDAERARIAGGIAALLAGTPASPEETFFVVRRLFAALAAARPVVLVIDDLQWAEPLLLDLVEHLVQWGSGVPLLVLVGARPELRDMRSSLVTPGGFVADVVTLAGLDAGAAMRLAANVIGAADLPAAVAAKVLATSEGNPLFVGELVRMLVHEGALKKEGDRWTTGTALAALEMPPTIHALLAARIERLRPEERTRARTRRGGRPPLLAQRGRGAAAARRRRSRRTPRIAAPQRADRARHRLVPRRAGAALPPRADPRRGLPPAAEGHARRAAHALRRLGAGARGRFGRARRDDRLAPRAGAPAPARTRSARRRGPRDRRARREASRRRRPSRARARRRAARGEPARPRDRAARSRRPRARRSRARLVRGAARGRRRRPRRRRRSRSSTASSAIPSGCARGTPASRASTRC